jgi:hypothetical protein
MIYEDRDFHVIRDRLVAADPDVAAKMARAIVRESAKQADKVPDKNDHRVIGFFMGRTQLSIKVRIFGPTMAIREMNAQAVKDFWTAVALAALEG